MLARCLLGLVVVWHGSQADIARAQERDPSGSTTSPGWSCRASGLTRALPAQVRESSGLVRSVTRPGILWTHNDRGSDPDLFAIDESGALVQRVRVGVPAVDWEDLEIGVCETGTCLYIGDIGDNSATRQTVTVYRIAEPEADLREADGVVALHARFPDGPKDAESLFVLPTDDLFLVTKGRRQEIALYRYPAPQRPDEVVLLERVRELFPQPEDNDDRVTAAAATSDGRWIGIRTYRTLYIYDAAPLVGGGAVDPTVLDLTPLAESQGEGLAIGKDGTIWLSTEAENKRSTPALNRLDCALPPS